MSDLWRKCHRWALHNQNQLFDLALNSLGNLAETKSDQPTLSNKILNEGFQLQKEHPEIKVQFIINEKNSGGCVFKQWKKGFNASTGDYIWIAEADDSAENDFVENLI